jgi:hypothetical protein
MSEKEIGTIVKAHCGRCNGLRNCEVKGFHSEGGSEADGQFYWNVDWYLLVCRGCDFPFAQTVGTDSESYYDYYDQNGEHVQESIETIDFWPPKAKRERPNWFEHNRIEGTHIFKDVPLNTALNELYRALDAGLLILSSIGIRTAFDAACEALEIETGLPFERKLEALVKNGKIRDSESDALNVLIEAGSAAAHRGWEPDPEQLDVQMDILEEFILNSMVLPARQKKKADKVEKLKKAVPPRQPRPKKQK